MKSACVCKPLGQPSFNDYGKLPHVRYPGEVCALTFAVCVYGSHPILQTSRDTIGDAGAHRGAVPQELVTGTRVTGGIPVFTGRCGRLLLRQETGEILGGI